MSIQFQIPSSTYAASHSERRRQLTLADDFLTTKDDTWYARLEQAQQRIHDYVEGRGTVDITVSPPANLNLFRKARGAYHQNIVLPSYQTFFGQYVSYRMYNDLAHLISKTYEHYIPVTAMGRPPTLTGSTTISNLDDAVRLVAQTKLNLDRAGNVLSNNLLKVTTDPLYLEALQTVSSQNLVSNNIDYLKDFNIPPYLLGADMVKQVGDRSGSNQYAQEFIATNILGWSNSNLSRRAVGSPDELMAIFMDVFFQNIELHGLSTSGKKFNADISGDDAITTVMELGSPIYQRLLSSTLVKNLSDAPAEFTNLPPPSAPTELHVPPGSRWEKNPFYIGMIDMTDPTDPSKTLITYRTPESLLLDVHYRTIRTPFYKRDLVEKKENLKFDTLLNFLTLGVEYTSITGGVLTLKTRPLGKDSDPQMIWKDLFGEKDKEADSLMFKVLSLNEGYPAMDTAGLVEGKPVDATLVNTQLKEFCTEMRNIGKDQQRSIISQAMNGLFMAILHAGLQNWSRFTSLFSPVEMIGPDENAFGGPSTMKLRLNAQEIAMSHLDQDQFRLQTNLLRSYLGTRGDKAVGSMGLSWSSPIQSGAMGESFTYPGDSVIIQNLGSYANMMYQDINKLRDVFTATINRTGTNYWYRDIIRWLELLYKVLEPNRRPAIDEKQRFDKLSTILRQVYLSGLTQMRNYISKTQQTGGDLSQDASVASAIMCYMKRQVQIVYYLLENIRGQAPWTNLPNMDKYTKMLRSQNEGAYRADVETYIATMMDVTMRKLARDLLLSDVCQMKTSDTKVSYLTDSVLKVIGNDTYWKILSRNLKGSPDLSLENPKEKFYGIYLPLMITSRLGGDKYYLFDIMPVVMEGKLGTTARSSPQWLNYSDLQKIKIYRKTNPGVVIVSNGSGNIINNGNWVAINSDWFDKLSKFKDDKMALRQAIYLLLRDPGFYKKAVNVKLWRDTQSTNFERSGDKYVHKIVSILNGYSGESMNKLNKDGHVFELISREIVESNLSLSQTELLSQ